MLKITAETMFPDSGGFTVYTARYDSAVGKGQSKHAAIADWIKNSDYTVKYICVEWVDSDGEENSRNYTDHVKAAEFFDHLLSADHIEYVSMVGYSDDTMFAECVELADSRTWSR